MKSYLRPGTFVLVEWLDAFGAGGWNSAVDIRANPVEAVIRTVGWVVSDDPIYLTLTMQHHLGTDGVGAVASVPQATIRKVTRLGAKYRAKDLE